MGFVFVASVFPGGRAGTEVAGMNETHCAELKGIQAFPDFSPSNNSNKALVGGIRGEAAGLGVGAGVRDDMND